MVNRFDLADFLSGEIPDTIIFTIEEVTRALSERTSSDTRAGQPWGEWVFDGLYQRDLTPMQAVDVIDQLAVDATLPTSQLRVEGLTPQSLAIAADEFLKKSFGHS